MQRLRIFIDPLLKRKYGPEINWTWRLLLSGIGYSWEEVHSVSSDSDIAYVTSEAQCRRCRLWVQANLDHWARRSGLRLETVARSNGLPYPLFQGEHSPPSISFKGNGCLVYERDIIFDIFWWVTGQQEKHWPKDKHGFFKLDWTPFLREHVFRSSIASDVGSSLEKK